MIRRSDNNHYLHPLRQQGILLPLLSLAKNNFRDFRGVGSMEFLSKIFKVNSVVVLSLILGMAELSMAANEDIENPTDQVQARGYENDVLQWINHLDFLPGHSVVKTSFTAVYPGTLVVRSTTTGDVVPGGGNKVVEMSLQVPPRHLLKGVRICYKSSNRRTYISQTRLAQLQNPPTSWLVKLDDPTHLNSTNPICVNSMEVPTAINPMLGSLRFPLRLFFGSIYDSVTIYSVGLWLQPY